MPVNVHLDPEQLHPLLLRLAALCADAAPPPPSGPQGPGLGPVHEILGTLGTESPVRRRMDELAAACAACASGAALADRGAQVSAELSWLRRELEAATADAVDRARTLGALDAAQAADIHAAGSGAAA